MFTVFENKEGLIPGINNLFLQVKDKRISLHGQVEKGDLQKMK